MARRQEESSSKPWAGFSFIRADALLTLQMLPRSQDCGDALVDGQDVEFPVLVSHRWTAPDQPDQHGQQLQALHKLVNAVADVALALFASPAEQLAAASSLAVHGVLQAAILASRFVCCHTAPSDRGHLLRRIGVWYDYSCMPQKPRTEEEDGLFKTSLRNLPILFSTASLVSLRESAGDDYMSRGRCLAEVASGDQSDFVPLTLYLDLLGHEIPPAKLDEAIAAGGESPYNSWVRPAADRARSFLSGWGVTPSPSGIEPECTTATAGSGCTRGLCLDQMDRCQLTGCCIHENFGVWCAVSLCSAQARVGLMMEGDEEEEEGEEEEGEEEEEEEVEEKEEQEEGKEKDEEEEEEEEEAEEGEEEEEGEDEALEEEVEEEEGEEEQEAVEEEDASRPTATVPIDGTELVGSLYQPGFEICVEIGNKVGYLELVPPFDLGDVLIDHLAKKGIECTNGGDRLRVGAWLLQSASCTDTVHARFFAILHERVLAGKSVRVVDVQYYANEDSEGEVLVATYDEDN